MKYTQKDNDNGRQIYESESGVLFVLDYQFPYAVFIRRSNVVTFRVVEIIVAHPTKQRFFQFEPLEDGSVLYTVITERPTRQERMTKTQAIKRYKWLTEKLGYQKCIDERHTISISAE